MAYHITKPSKTPGLDIVYYADNNRWTDVYENRKVYPTLFQAEQQKATTYTDKLTGKVLQATWWQQCTIVDES